MKKQLLENMIRKVIREELQRLMPNVVEQITESISAQQGNYTNFTSPRTPTKNNGSPQNPSPNQSAGGSQENVRRMLMEKFGVSNVGPVEGGMMDYGSPPSSPNQPTPGMHDPRPIVPERITTAGNARPLNPAELGEGADKVIQAMNVDYRKKLKAMGVIK